MSVFDLSGTVAVVTGGGRGIGRFIGDGLAAAGAHVVLCGRDRDTVEDAATEILAMGGRASAMRCDVSLESDVLALREAALAVSGRIDTLVCNAGINPIFASVEKVSFADWQKIIDVNLSGVFLCCKILGGAMAEAGAGSVINVSSVAGHVGLQKSAPYCAAKGGVELLTRALALDWAKRGVRVNTIAPGYFETDLTAGMRAKESLAARLLARTPQGRFGGPTDIAGAAVFLASPASAYMTGQSLVIDGGWTAE